MCVGCLRLVSVWCSGNIQSTQLDAGTGEFRVCHFCSVELDILDIFLLRTI